MTDQHTRSRSTDADFERYATLETAAETIVYEVENPAAWISSDTVVALEDAR